MFFCKLKISTDYEKMKKVAVKSLHLTDFSSSCSEAVYDLKKRKKKKVKYITFTAHLKSFNVSNEIRELKIFL